MLGIKLSQLVEEAPICSSINILETHSIEVGLAILVARAEIGSEILNIGQFIPWYNRDVLFRARQVEEWLKKRHAIGLGAEVNGIERDTRLGFKVSIKSRCIFDWGLTPGVTVICKASSAGRSSLRASTASKNDLLALAGKAKSALRY